MEYMDNLEIFKLEEILELKLKYIKYSYQVGHELSQLQQNIITTLLTHNKNFYEYSVKYEDLVKLLDVHSSTIQRNLKILEEILIFKRRYDLGLDKNGNHNPNIMYITMMNPDFLLKK